MYLVSVVATVHQVYLLIASARNGLLPLASRFTELPGAVRPDCADIRPARYHPAIQESTSFDSATALSATTIPYTASIPFTGVRDCIVRQQL